METCILAESSLQARVLSGLRSGFLRVLDRAFAQQSVPELRLSLDARGSRILDPGSVGQPEPSVRSDRTVRGQIRSAG